MRSLLTVFLCLLTCLFSGCFEMDEEITIDKNGSGNLAMKTNMGKSFSMLSAMMKPEDLQKAGIQEVKDTTISMKDILGATSSLADTKKSLLEAGTLRMQVNAAEQVFNLNTNFPFSSPDKLQQLYQVQGEAMEAILKGMALNGGGMMGNDVSMKMISSYFDLVTTKNSISRKLNKERYEGLATDQMMQQLKQMSAMMGGMGEPTANTVVKLSAPAKKIEGAHAELSTDKKIVTIKNKMLDIFEHPENFEYTIQY